MISRAKERQLRKAPQALLVTLLMFVQLCASAARADGNELLNQCESAERSQNTPELLAKDNILIKTMQCYALVQGARETMYIFNSSAPAHLKTCFPANSINNGQTARIVVQYLRNNPQSLHLPEVALIFRALRHAYPCR